MTKKAILSGFLAALLLLITVCSSVTYKEAMEKPGKKFFDGEFIEAARELLPEINKKSRARLLFMMETGLMLHTGEDSEASNRVFLRAASLADTLPISASQQLSSLLTEPGKTDYRGEDFERVLIHMYAGLNFLSLEEYEKARVEFRAVNEQLTRIRQKEGDAVYRQNLMAKYLAAYAFELTGDAGNDHDDWEYAYIELRQIHRLRPDIDFVKNDLHRIALKLGYKDDAAKWRRAGARPAELKPEDSGEILVFFQAGQNAIKESRGSLFDDKDMRTSINISLQTQSLAAGVTIASVMIALQKAEHPVPKYKKRSNEIDSIRIRTGRHTAKTFILEDIESTSIKTFEDNYSSMKKQIAASIAARAAASVAAGLTAQKIAEQSDTTAGAAGLIGFVVGMGTGSALFSQMKPDLRCWHTLPANLQLARLFVEPGERDITLEYLDNKGRIIKTEKIDAEIQAGERYLINKRTLQ